ncbi:MAG: class I SAM-dependent methyltransferase [Opitutaceae bacterium]|nr:class I SAM-dependent methyltransferase [Opitutaceae bacterium]
MNLPALNARQRFFYRYCVRPFSSAEERKFFEGIPGIAGQLYRAERRALHDAVVRRQPAFAFEIGTFNGGGSTYFLALAFAKLGRGKLVTLEIDPALQAKAAAFYTTQLPTLRPHVEFLLGGSPELFTPFLQQAGAAEFVFLDGAENAAQSLEQYRFFEPWFRRGSVLALHDWNTEKMRLIRELLCHTPRWRETLALAEPDSIGFALFEML